MTRGTAIGATVLAMTAAASTLGATTAHAAPHSEAPQCSQIIFLSVRGSGEIQADRGGFGKTMDAVRRDIEALLSPSFRIKSVSVEYPAVSTDVLKPNGRSPYRWARDNDSEFAASIDDGVTKSKAALNSLFDKCSDAKIILGGYSQGAMVAHQLQHELTPRQEKALVGTILVADGDRVTNSKAKLFGTAKSDASGVRTYMRDFIPNSLSRPTRDVKFPDSTVMITEGLDLVGDFNFWRAATEWDRAEQVHTQYVDGRGAFLSAALSSAIRELADDATRRYLETAPVKINPVAICGGGYSLLESQRLPGGVASILHRGNDLCGVTAKTRDPGEEASMSASIRHWNGTKVTDAGRFRYYAGPVRMNYPGTVYWGGAADEKAQMVEKRLTDIMKPGDSIREGTALWPVGFKYQAILQNDGNFAVYKIGSRKALWATGDEGGKRGDRLTFQTDGNIVLYRSNGVAWSPNVQGQGGETFLMQEGGNLVLYAKSGVVWATETNGK